MSHYVVIDTNIVISSLLYEGSLPGMIINEVAKNELIPILNNEILNEYIEVMKRSKFMFKNESIESTICLFEEKGIFIEKLNSDTVFNDIDDKVFYDIFLSSRMNYNSYLVTGNLKHFPKEENILNPREFLEKIGFIK